MEAKAKQRCPVCKGWFKRVAMHAWFCGEGEKQRARRAASCAGGRQGGRHFAGERAKEMGRKGGTSTVERYGRLRMKELAVLGGVAKGREQRRVAAMHANLALARSLKRS